MNRKKRRHSGRVTPNSTIKLKKSKLIEECLEPKEMYDDWTNYRDGFRGYDDRTKLRSDKSCFAKFLDIKRWNKKIKKLIKIRKARLNNKSLK